ncbi:MAG: glucose 1-dehydrogenase [Candidatus Nomurabacteria bacterium]|jgi:gluconate 5-dehydrogenase|nr:glucose 1-dehydrogenase [Candidatus Nomurabacteria bacterium]
MFDLKDKVAVVTGASSGLGADSARAYAKNGVNVALLARRKEKIDALAKELKDFGVEALAVQCDVTDETQVKKAVAATIKKFGRIDILLNNAGVAVSGGVDTLTEENWDKSMNANVKSAFLVSKYIVPQMIKQKYGKIVNISSVNAKIADKLDVFIRHGYNASKGAVLGLTLGMAASYGKHNITVNSIGPGLFESEMTKDTLFKSKDFLDSYNAQCPMGRPGNKGELTGTVLYLSSDASSYVTGQYIIVDGGMTLV